MFMQIQEMGEGKAVSFLIGMSLIWRKAKTQVLHYQSFLTFSGRQ